MLGVGRASLAQMGLLWDGRKQNLRVGDRTGLPLMGLLGDGRKREICVGDGTGLSVVSLPRTTRGLPLVLLELLAIATLLDRRDFGGESGSKVLLKVGEAAEQPHVGGDGGDGEKMCGVRKIE